MDSVKVIVGVPTTLPVFNGTVETVGGPKLGIGPVLPSGIPKLKL